MWFLVFKEKTMRKKVKEQPEKHMQDLGFVLMCKQEVMLYKAVLMLIKEELMLNKVKLL